MMGPLDATKCLPASALPQLCELLARPRQPFARGPLSGTCDLPGSASTAHRHQSPDKLASLPW